MKNLILSLLAVFIFSFSFSQDKPITSKQLQANSQKGVEYLKKELRLKGEKLSIISDAYKKYANEISKLNEKMTLKNKSAKGNKQAIVENKKAKWKMMSNFLKQRDETIKKSMSKKEAIRYDDVARSIHPFTLELRLARKK